MDRANRISTAAAPITVIRPSKGWVPINFRELWAYRELLYFLSWRDIKVRYKQTLLGASYAIIRPLFMMIVFSLVFGTLAKIPSEGIPYPLFSYAALLPWTLFAEAVNRSSTSLVTEVNLVQKVYFPRLVIPLSSIFAPLLDFAIAFVVLIGLMIYFSYSPTITILWLPALILLELMLALGVGLWLSAINVEYRDVRHITPFLIQIWMYLSPVIYATTLLPERFRIVYMLNPMTGIIESFRWAILGTTPPSYSLITSVVISLVLLVSGALYFRRRERIFADVA